MYITDTENHQENNEEMEAVTDVSPDTAGVPYEADWEISRLAPISEDCDPPNEYDSEILFVLVSSISIKNTIGFTECRLSSILDFTVESELLVTSTSSQ